MMKMDLKRIMSNFRRPLALIIALFMLFMCIGCVAVDNNVDGYDNRDERGTELSTTDFGFDSADTPREPQLPSVDTFTDTPNADIKPTETEAPESEAVESDIETSAPETEAEPELEPEPEPDIIDEHGYYYSRDDVALYIHTYNKLPPNFITKDEAEELGWEGGSVERFLEGAAIGGSRFSNREGLLPKKNGRTYYECDIDTDGGKPRGAKRIVYSNDGLIYYTDDHYESFTLLYGEE